MPGPVDDPEPSEACRPVTPRSLTRDLPVTDGRANGLGVPRGGIPGTPTSEEKNMNCPHGPCHCLTEDGGYCSRHCEDMSTAGVVAEQCQCGHPACTQA